MQLILACVIGAINSCTLTLSFSSLRLKSGCCITPWYISVLFKKENSSVLKCHLKVELYNRGFLFQKGFQVEPLLEH